MDQNVEIDYNYCDVSGLSKDSLSTCWDDSMVITVAVSGDPKVKSPELQQFVV